MKGNISSRTTRRLLIAISLCLFPAAMAPVVLASSSYHRVVRAIETPSFAVPHPSGLTYVTDGGIFAYMSAAGTGGQAGETLMMQVGFSDDPLGATTLSVSLSNPLNLAYNPLAKKLLLFDDLSNELIEYSPGVDKNLLAGGGEQRFGVGHFGLAGAGGMAIDPNSGDLFILDPAGRQVLRVRPGAGQALRGAEGYQYGELSRISLRGSRNTGFRGLAFNPADGHLYVLQPASRRLFEFSPTGQMLSIRDLSGVPMQDPRGMVFAPSGDRTDDPANTSLYLADSGLPDTRRPGQIIEISLTEPVFAAASVQSNLVRTIDTSLFYPPSPDPAGLAWQIAGGRFFFSDSEVNEMRIFTGDNLFEMTTGGSLFDSMSTMAYSNEPTGLAFNTVNGHLFVSDDNARRVNEVDPGGDGLFGTPDDTFTRFDTLPFNSDDPEGAAFDSFSQTLFIVDGVNNEVYVVRPGSNGVFDGVPPDGDDQVSHFDTAGFGITDPEGIEFNDASGTLYLVGNGDKRLLAEVTTNGIFVQGIDISAANARAPSGLARGPSSLDPQQYSIYISDRGVDNGENPNENDGKIYEMTLPLSGPDETAPTVTAFDLPGASGSLTVPILAFTATDNVGVTGYLATESAAAPSAGDPGWTATAPTSYTFASEGTQILYGWAKDAAGNVSASSNDTVVITLGDTTPPVMTGFDLPDAYDSLTVPILIFTATDNVGVAGYLATESSSTPSAGAAGWTAAAPTSHTFASEGTQTLYGWAKDAAANVSAAQSDTVVISTGSGQEQVVEKRVAASSDDVEESRSGSMDLTSSDLELGTEDGSSQTVGLRFAALAIPQGATITDAYIQFTVDEADSVATSVVFRGQAADNASPFDSARNNITSRPQTAAGVSWSPGPWTVVGLSGPDQRTPNLAPIIQEIVNRPGWAQGNSLVIIISGSGERTAESYEGQAQSAPLLHVVYQAGGSGDDTTPPEVTAFDLPETSDSLTVPILSFTATDDTGVTGYLATESTAAPSAGAAGWTTTAPTSYTFSSEGTQTLYGWAKDAAGNVSASLSDTVTITLPDGTPPVVTAFDLPSTSDSLTVSILSFTATDDTGVTGYLATESAAAPSAGAAGWAATAPTSYSFAAEGTQTLYGWAKDAAGNVSASLSDTVTITLPDGTPPVVTAFDLPETSDTLTVSILSFTATDDTGVTGYLATESATAPSAGAAGWTATAPTSYTFAAEGTQTLYGWAKDAAGNVSASLSDTVTITRGVMHVGDLDGSTRVRGKSGKWEASVTVTVHDQNHSPVVGASVSGAWSGDLTGTVSGVTDGNGHAALSTGNLDSGSTVTLSVTGVSHVDFNYDPASNHDPDGDSDGTVITVIHP